MYTPGLMNEVAIVRLVRDLKTDAMYVLVMSAQSYKKKLAKDSSKSTAYEDLLLRENVAFH